MRLWSKWSRLSVVAALAVFGSIGFGCQGFKAGTRPIVGAGGVGGAGGTAGTMGSAGAGTTGTGGRIIITGEGGTVTPTGAGGTGNSVGTSTPDANCGARDKAATRLLPDVLIVLDRSGSMNDGTNNMPCTGDGGMGAPRGCGADSKWAKVTPAITQVVSETEMDVNWGLKFFPDNTTNTCNVSGTAEVPIAPGNGAAVTAAIAAATDAMGGVVGYNNTPTRSGMTGAVTYLGTVTTMNPKYILLATDGLPNCAASGAGGAGGRGGGGPMGGMADDSPGATTAVAAALTAGFKTFVVGIATAGLATNGVNADMTLSNMANAGGLPRSGTPTYYPVTSAAELADAIRKLITQANTCTFQVGPTPTTDGTTDLRFINVFGDGVEIKRDITHADGWDYTDASMGSIEIYGPTCEQVKTATIRNVTVTFRCIFT
jgi:hypothetical protein